MVSEMDANTFDGESAKSRRDKFEFISMVP